MGFTICGKQFASVRTHGRRDHSIRPDRLFHASRLPLLDAAHPRRRPSIARHHLAGVDLLPSRSFGATFSPTSHSSNLGIGNVRLNSNLKLVQRHYVHPAMLGSRARVYTVKLRGRRSPTVHTAIVSMVDEVRAIRFNKIFITIQAARFDDSYELPQLKHWLLNDAHYRSAPPMIAKGDAGCHFGPRAVQYVI
ncbi:BQ5605_C047g12323 [Microbotryum silenes-dioicae]|uniref:BQ5605_C047g12323 protein n=1 Tax=Microbotryum silenes-dioicae TaxID=796604 RepID=A0A2X0MSQ7_9BASI|nr:BQ5605_C047g12323 [Microbotryum silenes-dioicae]